MIEDEEEVDRRREAGARGARGGGNKSGQEWTLSAQLGQR